MNFQVDDVSVNKEVFNKLCAAYKKPKFNLECKMMVQRRKHRKKRINKKWAKRYGYKPITVRLRDIEIKYVDEYTFNILVD
jgi:hypothetical protein